MKSWKRWIVSLTLAVFVVVSLQVTPGAANTPAPFEPINLSELKDGKALYDPLRQVVTDALEMDEEDASAITEETFYEVDLGNYPKGYTRQFIGFVYNYEWIELVLIATNDRATDIRLLDRVSSTEEGGDMFINMAKLDFVTQDNYITVWTQAPFSAYQSTVELEWAGDKFYYISHEVSDPTAEYYAEKERLLKAKDIPGLIAQYESEFPFYPASYEGNYTLAAPVLKLAHQKALQAQKNNKVKTAIQYLEYGLEQYAEGFDTWGYVDGTLVKSDLVASKDSVSPTGQLSLSVYVGILNDYGYFLSLAGRNKEALPILANVVKLVPTRTVAYLNLADVEWTLGQRSSAKAHYNQYVKLLGSKAATTAPKRVQERIKAK